MGETDIEKLFDIYYEALLIAKKYDLPYRFKIDEGTYETAIEFIDEKTFHPPISLTWSTKPVIFCPDLLDYHHKIIIEYEEEVGELQKGAKLATKGHNREGDIDNKRDEKRNQYYNQAGFSVLRIWKSDDLWRDKLKTFLFNFIAIQ